MLGPQLLQLLFLSWAPTSQKQIPAPLSLPSSLPLVYSRVATAATCYCMLYTCELITHVMHAVLVFAYTTAFHSSLLS